MGKKMERIEKKMAKKIKYEKTVIEGVKDVPVKDIASESYFQTVLRRFKRHHLAVASLAVVAVLGGAALLAPVIAPYQPDEIVGTFSGAPCKEFWLVAAAVFKPGLWNIILILGFVDWPGIARLVRGNVLNLRETNFIKGNIIAGMPVGHILFSEILPNTVAPILVYATSVLALSMLDEAALSFLGLGVQPPAASLGNMLNGAQSLTVLTKQPWLWIPPGLLIVVLVMAINFIGDALRDALDPNSGRV